MLRVKRYVGTGALPPAYEPVFAQGARDCFFASLPWFRLFERSIVGDGERVLVYGVEGDGAAARDAAVAALVLRERREPHRAWSASLLESLANYYTPCFAIPGTGGERSGEVAEALVQSLWSDRSRWDALHLWPLDPEAPVFSSLVRALERSGAWVQTHFCFGNWYLDVGGRAYAEYLQGLPSVLRKNIPYATRRLERTHRVALEILTRVEDLERGLTDYERVYRSSWRPVESHPGFIRGLARLAAERGSLRLGLLYLDGEPAAAEIWIVEEGVASIYKVCYDERFGKLSVGTVLTARVMERVIDQDRARVVDYLSGDDEYKRHWMSHRRERWGIMAFNPRRVGGFLLATRHVGGRAAKSLLGAAVARLKRGAGSPT